MTSYRFRPAPLAITAVAVAEALAEGRERRARTLLFQFINDWRAAHPDDRPGLVAEEPPPTGERRYDAFVAATAEFLCATSGVPIPRWTRQPHRFAEPFFFLSDAKGLWGRDLVDSPITFSRHGVFIPRESLEGV
ncbi:MAG: hypothetical protein ACRDZQ_07915 [Acidimicrobiales bacterium]